MRLTADRSTDLPPEHRRAAADLVSATRDLMLAAAVTGADPSELRAAEQAITEVTRLLSKDARARALRPPFEEPVAALAAGPRRAFPLVTYNPLGVPFDVRFDGNSAFGEVTANALCEGPRDNVHGGVSAWLMDVMLGILVQAHGTRSVTATLDLRYLAPTPLDQPLRLHSRITRREGRKTYAEGVIEHDGRRTVEAAGLFIALPAEVVRP